MTDIPPFPDGLPLADMACLSLAKLIADNEHESERLFDEALDSGFFFLDLTDAAEGRELLEGVESAFKIGEHFFGQELDEKMKYSISGEQDGYKPRSALKLPNGEPGPTEFYILSKDNLTRLSNGVIPPVYDENRSSLAPTVLGLHKLSLLILKRLAKHLDVPPGIMDTLHDPSSLSYSQLRFLHNISQPDESTRQTSLLGHTDSGSLTVLFNKLGGLQILPPDAPSDDDSAWRWVKPQPGCAIVNIGDPLVQWSGGILRSAFHRVAHAPGQQAAMDRYSFGYFLKPANAACMERLQQGTVIPRKAVDDPDDESRPYKIWYADKTKGIYAGKNNASRGGLGRKLLNRSAVPASA